MPQPYESLGPEFEAGDDELVAACNRGDPTAFEVLYYRHRDWVVNLAFRFLHDRDEALDVLQETFAYLARKFPGFHLAGRMTSFLYPVVRNLSLTRRRKTDRYVYDTYDLDRVPAADPPDRSKEDLDAFLADLGDDHREVLLLRFIDGMSMNEIGAAMGIPAGTVKSRLHNALRRLREDPRTREFFDR